MDKRTGRVLGENPTSIKEQDAAMVNITPMEDVFVETFHELPSFGRFLFRKEDSLKIAGIGVVKEVKKKQ